MKKLIALTMILFLIVGCAKEISRKEIDRRSIPEHTETYNVAMPVITGKTIMVIFVPRTRVVHEYEEVLYEITYDDGTTEEKWELEGEQ